MNGHWEKSLIYIVPISHISSGNYCIKKVPKEDIEEVVADTFISLWLTAERINYKKYSSVKSYLGMIARNKAKDWLRAYRGEILELNDDILLIDGDVEHLILQKEQQLIIGRTLEKLRETDRKIFIMYYYRYKKIEEIAETLKIESSNSKDPSAERKRNSEKDSSGGGI